MNALRLFLSIAILATSGLGQSLNRRVVQPRRSQTSEHQDHTRNQQVHDWLETTTPPSPYVLYGPHGYRTYPHSRCQDVPTVDVNTADIEGDWNLIEYLTSFDGKPFPPHSPYLCPESRITFTPSARGNTMNVSQVSMEWPLRFRDVVEWVQHPKKSGIFFHEENIFALWTMKMMEVSPDDHMLFFFCIDYTIWPGWNHRGVFLLSRTPRLESKVKRKLSPEAHRKMKIDFHRQVNTTSCDPDEFVAGAKERWHPHKKINKDSITAPVHPWISRKHRRNLEVLH